MKKIDYSKRRVREVPEAKAKADVSNALNGRCDHGMLLTRTCAQCDR